VSKLGRNCSGILLIVLAICCHFAFTSIGPALAAPDQSAANALIENAQFWYQHGREDTALEMYQRVLSFDPNNLAANIGAARMLLALGRKDAAEKYIATLKRAAPDNADVQSLTALSSRSQAQAALLADARHLTDAGQFPAAVTKYRELFGPNNPPPADLAGEYYTLLVRSTTPDSVDQENAVDALRKVVAAHPQDKSLQLWLGRALILTEGYRSEGIGILTTLSADPSYAAIVRPLWRDALIWGGSSVENRDLLNSYLRHYPSDAQLDALQAQMQRDLPSPARMSVMLGNAALGDGKLANAEKAYLDAIQSDPNEPDSYVMLAILRLKQGRPAEARHLADQAIALAPSRRQEILGDIGQDPETLRRAVDAARRKVAGQYRQVDDLAAAGRYDEAADLLRRLMAGHENAGSLLLLADIRHRAGDDSEATALLRRATSLAPDNPDALLALAAIQTQTGEFKDAHASLDSADRVIDRAGTPAQRETWRSTSAGLLRQEAAAESDPSRRLALLGDALATAPADNWLRFEVARSLEKLNRIADAQAAIAPVLAAAGTGGEAAQVAFAWLDSHGQHRQAMAVAAALPDAQRTAEMRSALAAEALRQEIARRNPGDNLLDLARLPDPDGTRGQIIGRALLASSGVQAMRNALTAGLDATLPPASLTRLRYAALLIETHQFVAARTLLADVRPAALPADQRNEFAGAQDQLAAAEVAQWLQAGQIDRAAQTLAMRGERIASSPVLQAAGARIAMARGQTDQALAVLTALLAREPSDPTIRAAAVDAAVADDRPRLAAALAAEGMRLNPENPFLALQAAGVARQANRDGDALRYLQRARALRADELDQASSLPPG
jgi:cellulose synthase operon protein C